jgi:hypothetical protein
LAISGNYATPEYVNGYACWNCTAVAEAKKDINPADPQAGPFGIDAKNDPTVNQGSAQTPTQGSAQTPVVQFGGLLSGSTTALGSGAGQSLPTGWGLGGQVNISA